MKKIAKKFIIKTLGCKVNQYDSLLLKRLLQGAGFLFDEKDPSLVIINTCAVTKNAIRKDRRMLNGMKKKYPEAKFVMMGCFPETYPEEMERFEVDLVWGTGRPDELVNDIEKMFDVRTYVRTYICNSIEPPKAGGRSRYFLKIQDGCEQFCSYCNIPFARGKLSSRPKEEIIDELRDVVAVGFEEIVLCGIHLGLYGKEKKSKKCNLVKLLKELIKIRGLGRLRLSSIEINDINQDLLDLMSTSKKICDHLHIPLQSGCDKTLKRMNRPYNRKYFEEALSSARTKIPDIAITTDVIIGFPGETEEDFKQTLEFCMKCNFSKMHIFPFSQHEKTPAAKMNNKVDENIIKERIKILRQVAIKMEKDYKKKFSGKEISIIVEQVNNGMIKGKEEHYFDAEVPIEENAVDIGSLHKKKNIIKF